MAKIPCSDFLHFFVFFFFAFSCMKQYQEHHVISTRSIYAWFSSYTKQKIVESTSVTNVKESLPNILAI